MHNLYECILKKEDLSLFIGCNYYILWLKLMPGEKREDDESWKTRKIVYVKLQRAIMQIKLRVNIMNELKKIKYM